MDLQLEVAHKVLRLEEERLWIKTRVQWVPLQGLLLKCLVVVYAVSGDEKGEGLEASEKEITCFFFNPLIMMSHCLQGGLTAEMPGNVFF